MENNSAAKQSDQELSDLLARLQKSQFRIPSPGEVDPQEEIVKNMMKLIDIRNKKTATNQPITEVQINNRTAANAAKLKAILAAEREEEETIASKRVAKEEAALPSKGKVTAPKFPTL